MPAWTKRLLVLFFMIFLVACGTDEEETADDGTGNETEEGDQGDEESPGTASVSDLRLLVDGGPLDSAGNEEVTVIAVARNANNAAVSDAEVTFATEDDGLTILSPSALTNEQGSGETAVVNDFNAMNRMAEIRAFVDGTEISDSISVGVEGSSIRLSGPENLTVSESDTYTVVVQDSGGSLISGAEVSVTSENNNSIDFTDGAVTDKNGEVTFTLTADNSGGDVLEISALGASTKEPVEVSNDDLSFEKPTGDQLPVGDPPGSVDHDVTVSWEQNGSLVDGETLTFTSSRGELSDDGVPVNVSSGEATVTISSESTGIADIVAKNNDLDVSVRKRIQFISENPASISVQAVPSAIEPNQDGQSSNRSVVTATVRDDSGNVVANQNVNFTVSGTGQGWLTDNGTATTSTSGSASVEYVSGQFSTPPESVSINAAVEGTSIEDTAPLTVADSSFITVGSSGRIEEVEGESIYRVPHTIQVTNSDGTPAANTDVSLELKTTELIVGDDWTYDGSEWSAPASITRCVIGQDTEDLYGTATVVPAEGTDISERSGSVQVTTDSEGYANIEVLYPKDQAFWSHVELIGSADVGDIYPSRATLDFDLPVPAEALSGEAIPFATSPHGNGNDCNGL